MAAALPAARPKRCGLLPNVVLYIVLAPRALTSALGGWLKASVGHDLGLSSGRPCPQVPALIAASIADAVLRIQLMAAGCNGSDVLMSEDR
jgi:hypothetical protein